MIFVRAFACLVLATPAVAQDVVSPEIGFFEAGVICAQDSGVTRPAPDTVAGTTNVVETPPPFVSNERVVPAVLGIGFGVRAALDAPFGVGDVTMTVTHPAFPGSGTTRQSFLTRIGPQDAPGFTFYQFDYGYELVPGEWTMTAQVDDTVFYTATFTVVPPAALPELAGVCGYTDLLS